MSLNLYFIMTYINITFHKQFTQKSRKSEQYANRAHIISLRSFTKFNIYAE